MTVVLSLFDGSSCTQQAFKDLGIEFDGVTNKYYASEIDPYPITVTQNRFPHTIQLHCVKTVTVDFWVDYIVAGSPCQDLSLAGKGAGLFEGKRSNLFFEVIRIIREARKINPNVKVLIENVKMKKEYQDAMSYALSEVLGQRMYPVAINSDKWTAQSRNRLYWFNWDYLGDIQDKGIVLRDILETSYEEKYLAGQKLLDNYQGGDQLNPNHKSQANTIHDHNKKSPTLCAGTHGYCMGFIDGDYFKYGDMSEVFGQTELFDQKSRKNPAPSEGCKQVGMANLKGHDIIRRVYSEEGKAPTLTTMTGGNRHPKVYVGGNKYRRLTPKECERLQGLPDDFSAGVSDSRRYAMLGNGFTVPVISHILKPTIEGNV